MKVVILAGGFGTRISEESHLTPKPMIEIGGMPILWHIMKIYSSYGFNDFVICCGYKSYAIKKYFTDYYLHCSDVTLDMKNGNSIEVHKNIAEPWRVTMIDTGLHTMTGGRIKRIEPYVKNETFLLTYGDGVSDVDIGQLVEFHKSNAGIATVTAIKPEARFGILEMKDNRIESFREKVQLDVGWINGGFMVMEPQIFDYIKDDSTIFEREPLELVAAKKQLYAYKHNGFWQCMDTQRDKHKLEELWESGSPPWKKW